MSAQRSGHALGGILLYSAGVLFFSINDALGKWLAADYGVAQIMALRGIGAITVLGAAIGSTHARFTGPRPLGLHLARVAFSTVDIYCFYLSAKTLPLADVMTLYLAAPLIVVALSCAVLGERVGVQRWAAVVAGFAGVVIALHPSGAALSPGALVALAGSFMFALSLTITRLLRQTSWVELATYQMGGSVLVGAALAPVGWIVPSVGDLALMSLVGLVSMSCMMCITKAVTIAPASLLAPFQYLSIVWATLLGWIVWGDVPSQALVAGCAVIVASGLFVVRHEGRVAAAEAAA